MVAPEESVGPGRKPQIKIARLIEEYELDELGAELERFWTAEEDRQSLRDLADFFNQRLLEVVMEEAGLQPLDGEIENLYRLLESDDVNRGTRIEAIRRLEREGIDVESLSDDFVSHQAIHTYLTKHRGIDSPSSEDEAGTESSQESIQRLESRTAVVVDTTLSGLRDKGKLDLPDYDVFVDIRITCNECQSQHEVSELLKRGGCVCRE